MARLTALLAFTLTLPLLAQDSSLFPRFSVTGGTSMADFRTDVRIDPDELSTEGTLVSFERDLGLEASKSLPRFTVQWRPFVRHELAASHFSAKRGGVQQIDREITFRDEVYPVQALVTTNFDLDYWSATYTYWARRSDRDGFGITLGAATLSMNASITAERPGTSVTVSEEADTDVPVALGGIQGRFAFTRTILGEASIAALPRVTIEDYTGSAVTALARLEYRPVRWLGIGAAYNYFRLDVDVAQVDLSGTLKMTVRGPEGYVRLAF